MKLGTSVVSEELIVFKVELTTLTEPLNLSVFAPTTLSKNIESPVIEIGLFVPNPLINIRKPFFLRLSYTEGQTQRPIDAIKTNVISKVVQDCQVKSLYERVRDHLIKGYDLTVLIHPRKWFKILFFNFRRLKIFHPPEFLDPERFLADPFPDGGYRPGYQPRVLRHV